MNTIQRIIKNAVLAGMSLLLLSSCTFSFADLPSLLPATQTPSYPMPPTPTPQPNAEVVFSVALPAPLLPGETVVLSIVDEVTGIALNPVNHILQPVDDLHYTVSIPIPVFSVVKYRYVKQGSLPQPESDPLNQAVRYRLGFVTGAASFSDSVAGWVGTAFSGGTGRISGVVKDELGNPLVSIMVVVGGQQTLTDSSGFFALESVLAGTSQNMVAVALDGAHVTFQQGVIVDPGKHTPVAISMPSAPLVNVIFTVIVPPNTVGAAPLRMAGNLLQLGNTFADLNGGMSTVANRMPVMALLPDGRYSISLMLPAGADVRYKYTLGDGFWNSEHAAGGGFVTRQLIVPHANSPVLVADLVNTWQAGTSNPITFEVDVPANTPAADIISIQFNPYGWTEPIPMWPMGNSRWVYTLYGPLNMLGAFEYRYCRNDQCGAADDAATPGNHYGRAVSTSLTNQDLQDTVTSWMWMEPAAAVPLVGVSVQARSPFWAGVEFQADSDPTWQAWMPVALQNISGIGANWVVLTPSWTFERTAPVEFSQAIGTDPFWSDTTDTISRARAGNLNVAVYPSANFPGSAEQWWSASPHDAAWWSLWFERYQAFTVHHADLASVSGAQALILGGEWLAPALPGSSIAANDAEARWTSLIATVRQHYSGPLFWALPYSGGIPAVPGFLQAVDGIYLLWNAPLSTAGNPSATDMQVIAGQLLDSQILPVANQLQKPIIIALAAPSVDGSAAACLADGAGGCLAWQSLDQPNPNLQGTTLNLAAQSDLVLAMLGAINTRPWVGGFVSRGYYPPAALLDHSASIHGKPAADILWYWYPRMLGTVP